MNIVVCMKQVPDTETKPKLRADKKGIEDEGVNCVVNPYDEFAIEEAIRIKEKSGGTVTLVTLGKARAMEALRTGLAMGADTAIHICDDAFDGSDSYVVAKALAAAVKTIPHDIVLCGHKAIDSDEVQCGARLAEALDLPQVYMVTKLDIAADGKSAICQRQIEGAIVTVETLLPAVLTCQKGLNEPRYPSLPGIMKAKKKEVKTMKAADLGFTTEQVGVSGALTETVDMFLPPPRAAGKIIDGSDPAAAARELAKLLREEAKVI